MSMANNHYTILVVDDVEEIAELVARVLKTAGYQTLIANDAKTALGFMEQQLIDLAVVDINMPLINGIHLLRQMRQRAETERIPVIMLTALSDSDTTLECLRSGACGYITKPFNMKGLLGQVDHCIARPA
ncbi:response regulator [Sulfuriflexus mobilis]|uniref:response regulator n=1 Tax=Sulfuriflexus mobilis TaxID=1811807 RepID=UPI000F83DE08|nr:response regulator [Sulfuriflexus mobilis]